MAKRQVFNIPGLGHGSNPIPLAVRVGSTLYTGSIDGRIPESGTLPEAPEEQIAQAFRNVRRLMELAGGSTDDIAKVDVRLSDMALRAAVNRDWVAMFPDEHDRPVRHTTRVDLSGGNVIQLEITAHLDER